MFNRNHKLFSIFCSTHYFLCVSSDRRRMYSCALFSVSCFYSLLSTSWMYSCALFSVSCFLRTTFYKLDVFLRTIFCSMHYFVGVGIDPRRMYSCALFSVRCFSTHYFLSVGCILVHYIMVDTLFLRVSTYPPRMYSCALFSANCFSTHYFLFDALHALVLIRAGCILAHYTVHAVFRRTGCYSLLRIRVLFILPNYFLYAILSMRWYPSASADSVGLF